MQIPLSITASAAASSVSQAGSKDRIAAALPEAAHDLGVMKIEQVAASEALNADRDAQGGGEGLGRQNQQADVNETLDSLAPAPQETQEPATRFLPPEPPCELDIVG